MIPKTGAVTFVDVNYELMRTNQPVSLNDAAVRRLADKASGTISFSDLRGASCYRITSGASGDGLRRGWVTGSFGALQGPSGTWQGRTLYGFEVYDNPEVATITFGIYVTDKSTPTPAWRGIAYVDGVRLTGTWEESGGGVFDSWGRWHRLRFSPSLMPNWQNGFSEVILLA
ncbi:hypothetical protein MNJPNG_06410 [Cupriavidus oxalaticus]|uniref:hypothetical protein n=1 Tax=Cupriavidus oxalaticus TaxID=96344 RepID=UPI003F7412E6